MNHGYTLKYFLATNITKMIVFQKGLQCFR